MDLSCLNTGYLMLCGSIRFSWLFHSHANLPFAYFLHFPLEFKISAKLRAQAEISSASVKSLVNPSYNRADLHSSDQKGSISNPPLYSAHTPNCYELDCYHRSESSFASILQLDSGFLIFYDHPHPGNDRPCFIIGPGT